MTLPAPVTLHDASVYSAADPFATAVQFTGATVSWLGSDEAAAALGDDRTVSHALDGAVVTPAFVAHVDLADPGAEHALAAAGPAAGYAGLELLGDDPHELARAADAARERGLHPLPVLVRAVADEAQAAALEAPRRCLGVRVGPGVAASSHGDTSTDDPGAIERVTAHVEACTRAGLQAVIVCGSAAHGPASEALSEAVLEALESVAERLGERAVRARGHRMVGAGELTDDQCHRLAGLGISVSARPGDAPLATLARDGVPVMLLSAQAQPWHDVKSALEAKDPRRATSARAAFLAMTRAAWRVQRDANPLAGQLVPGAPADLTVWRAESLAVQQAAGTGASWSTDPRARTPVLPSLDDATLPQCVATVVAGRSVFGPDLGARGQ